MVNTDSEGHLKQQVDLKHLDEMGNNIFFLSVVMLKQYLVQIWKGQ